ncbi:MogA/MoaB family molybdenum cofactor biosynthesis protein [Cellulomonas sp. zg-ZUI222]|uniref:MogA/MoaB family molybdenum cofactor biosynthesis protein n=1 Tax=Cellulomonas wangleii TaxID=2816956 RepID=A0ABX8D8Y3_9CELL|nr:MULTISPECIES: MogA/MoaB family molybdenum cofactor biosynthesis protein [Cellulomonas]MBO0900453.1 MogA/MoaB family molybdenum cofactor biosynthesis protein [Cellulomonas sp. zg-ZUI22]MBO0922717.1 MogA/MoaB family molybdenum cofactor biosynthesis protein [Cellulomonas wangleii]MBO0926418.1 MogA/MoaB family molybdenum cofactor biosynthesis protein [Cellulomonas wangleii]QVI63909.1 MogA/MoaB family molybdenum cofactor biosynthesis protein [Cellulomonas wangleii]
MPEPTDATTPCAVVVTVSDRAAAGTYDDVSGPVLVDGLRALGLRVADRVVVPDGMPVERALRQAVASGAALVLTTGGTGLGPRDLTPEATLAVVDRTVPGIAEALRADGVRRGVPGALLSRGVAGVAGRTLVVNVAGSPGAARDALEVLAGVLPHALSQLAGGDHPG